MTRSSSATSSFRSSIPGSQLIDQAKGEFSELTNGFEFRVRYSFLTTWVRHYQVLPFAILLFLPAIVWAAYLTTAWFVSEVFRTLEKTTVYVAAAFPTALFYMIMIYAKITHFYTLVFGLMLMTISIVVMLDALIFRTERWGRRMVAACAVTLLNPAVHYLVLFALFMTLTVTALLLGEFAPMDPARRPRSSCCAGAPARRGSDFADRRRRSASSVRVADLR